MRQKTINAIKAHARAEYPRECCGVVIAIGRKEEYVPCRNLADGMDDFKLSAEDYADAEDRGRIISIVHSHPNASALPSEADKIACEKSGLPWHIISLGETEFGEIRTHEPCGYKPPLVGRQFLHGVTDCYAIIRDYYERELGVALPDFERDDDWWNNGQNLYMDGYRAAGFTPLQDGETLDVGDMIFMQIRSPVVNHAGLYLGRSTLKESPHLHPVPDAMLHHMYGMLSERVVYGGQWRECTRLILRHRG
jgi:proteasome lid subunit RPN8/RPN11